MIELVMICVTVMVVVATVCNTAIEIYKIKKKPTISYEFLGDKSNSENVNLEQSEMFDIGGCGCFTE